VSEAVVALLSLGQQVMQQQQEQPTVCFAAVPLMLPAAVIMLRALGVLLAIPGIMFVRARRRKGGRPPRFVEVGGKSRQHRAGCSAQAEAG
jgi:hypothetical protein